MQYCLAIPFFDKLNLFCMCQCKAFAQMVDIWKFAACCLNREKGFLILCSSLLETAPGFLTVNLLGSWFNYWSKTREYNNYMLRWSYKTIWIHFNLILMLKCKISAIWLVETAHIFLIFLIATVHISMECETQES